MSLRSRTLLLAAVWTCVAAVGQVRAEQQLVSQQAEIRSNMLVSKHTTRAQVNQVLTPEQQERHQQLRQERAQHRQGNKGHRGGFGR